MPSEMVDVRILLQIGTVLVALGGGWMLIKSNLKTAQRDLEELAGRLKDFDHEMNQRLDVIEQDKSVTKRQVEVFTQILSPNELKIMNREMGGLLQKVESLERGLRDANDRYDKAHNGTHPPTQSL